MLLFMGAIGFSPGLVCMASGNVGMLFRCPRLNATVPLIRVLGFVA